MNWLKRFWQEHPLASIIMLALIPRIIAAVFSKGYGMHDDHFGPIEQPFIIMNDITYWSTRTTPHGHSIFYPLIHYALFQLFTASGILDPQAKMYIVRLLHALYSLIVVFFGFKIAEVLSNRETAKKVGIVLALFWAFPFLSVRNLIEMVCIPPLMAGFYYALCAEKMEVKKAFIAGLWLGLAFVFRYQTLSIAATLGIVMLCKKEFKQVLLTAAGFLSIALIIQGGVDIFAWGYPFASFREYMLYNATHGNDYTTGPWYNYSFLILGALIPPISFFIVFGFFKNWRSTLLIVLPVLVFFISHSFFPNKQERFIFPVIPIIITLGIAGWENYVSESAFWKRHRIFLKSCWIWFWIINFILLVPFSLYYSKRSRVEAMYALYNKPISGIVMVGGKMGVTQPPFFYSGKYPIPTYIINNEEQLTQEKAKLDTIGTRPNFAIFFGPEDIENRVHHIESVLGMNMQLESKIEASFLDDIFYRLNPRNNKNQTLFLFEITKRQ